MAVPGRRDGGRDQDPEQIPDPVETKNELLVGATARALDNPDVGMAQTNITHPRFAGESFRPTGVR